MFTSQITFNDKFVGKIVGWPICQITGRISTTGWPGYKSPAKVSKSFSEHQWALRDLRARLLFVLSFFADGALPMLDISDIHNKHNACIQYHQPDFEREYFLAFPDNQV